LFSFVPVLTPRSTLFPYTTLFRSVKAGVRGLPAPYKDKNLIKNLCPEGCAGLGTLLCPRGVRRAESGCALCFCQQKKTWARLWGICCPVSGSEWSVREAPRARLSVRGWSRLHKEPCEVVHKASRGKT